MYLATAGESVCLYKTDNYEIHQAYKPVYNDKKGAVRDLSWSYDGRHIGIVVDGSPIVEIARVKEDIKTSETIRVVDPTSIAFSKHGNGLVGIGNKNGVVHAANYINKNASKQFPSCCAKITSMDFNLTDSSIAVGTCEGKTHIYGMQSGKKTGLFELRSPKVVSSVKFHAHRRGVLSVGCHDGSVTVWDINFGHIECQYLSHCAPCTGLVFSPINRTFMASVGFDAAVYCYDIKSKKMILKADIPEPGSCIDMHRDGTTMAIGTARGSVHVFDMRNFRIPIKHFVTRSSCVNKVVYQPISLGARKSSISVRRSSLTGRLVHQVESPTLLEKTMSSPSSLGDVFSPLSQDGDVFSPLSHNTSFQSLLDSSSVKQLTDSIFQGIKCTRVDANENIQPFSLRGDEAEGNDIPGHSNSDALLFALPKSHHRLSDSYVTFRNTESSDSNKQSIQSCPKENIEPIFKNIAYKNSKSASEFNCNPSSKLLDLSLMSESKEDCNEEESVKHVSVSAKKSTQSCPKENIEPIFENIVCKNSKSTSELNCNPRSKLLDLSLMSESKENCNENAANGQLCDLKLLSFLQPLDSEMNVTQDNYVESSENKSLTETCLQDNVDSKILAFEESNLCGDFVDFFAANFIESQDEKASPVELNEILDKYSISNGLKDDAQLSMTFESTIDHEKPEISSVKNVPPELVSLDQSSKEVVPTEPLVKDIENVACVGAECSIENLSSLKEYIDGMVNDLSVNLRRQMFVMHAFNVSAHMKQEMMLNKILSQLNKEKMDKSVGTDGVI